MTHSFFSEDRRKDQLFAAWIKHLREFHSKFDEKELKELYEGIAIVSRLAGESFDLELEDGTLLKGVSITSEISCLSKLQDHIFVVLGRTKVGWNAIDIVSVGSTVEGDPRGAHITFNPLYLSGHSTECAITQ